MTTENNTRKFPRFRVETIDGQFVIFDTQTWTYTPCPPGTARFQAEQQCAVRNLGTVERRSDEPISLEREFDEKGVTPEKLIEFQFGYREPPVSRGTFDHWRESWGPTVHAIGGAGRMRVKGEAVLRAYYPPPISSKAELATILRRWAEAVAAGYGHDGAKRVTWSTWSIVKILQAGNSYPLQDMQRDVDHVQSLVWPHDDAGLTDAEFDRRTVICTHYLSTESARIKAGFLGMSKATYMRILDAAHREVLEGWNPKRVRR